VRYRSARGASLLERDFLWTAPGFCRPVQRLVNSLGACRGVNAILSGSETSLRLKQ